MFITAYYKITLNPNNQVQAKFAIHAYNVLRLYSERELLTDQLWQAGDIKTVKGYPGFMYYLKRSVQFDGLKLTLDERRNTPGYYILMSVVG
ncbi:hypothetical protein [Mucilaginibacter sp. PAMB04168]|uniref:hypothetical protein n=1 Tax=Mucilaginibacter sp. PAMB04168 TaxID=3138567 RepID=UPI0031F64E0D